MVGKGQQYPKADFLFFFWISQADAIWSDELEMAVVGFLKFHEYQEDGFNHLDTEFCI